MLSLYYAGFSNLMSQEDLPPHSAAPSRRDVEPLFEAIRQASYEGVQHGEPATPGPQGACARLGLGKADSSLSGRASIGHFAEFLAPASS